jgi:hypothetical protein
MMTGNKSYRWARRTGFALGLALSLVLAISWQVPAGTGRLGLDVQVIANKTGELDVEPTGVFVQGNGLEPRAGRDAAQGKVTIRNQTPKTLDVRMRLLPGSPDLNRVLLVDAEARGTSMFAGLLGTLRSWSRNSVRVDPGKSFELDLRLQLPQGAGDGYRGRIEDIVLELQSKPVGGSGGR